MQTVKKLYKVNWWKMKMHVPDIWCYSFKSVCSSVPYTQRMQITFQPTLIHIWVVAGIVFSLRVQNAFIHHHAVEMLFGRRKNIEFQTVFRNFDLYLLNAKVYVKSCAFPSIILFFLLLQWVRSPKENKWYQYSTNWTFDVQFLETTILVRWWMKKKLRQIITPEYFFRFWYWNFARTCGKD